MGFTGLKNGTVGLDIPPNTIAHTEGFTVLKENTVITNFQPHFHLRGKAMQVEAILPDGSTQIVSYVDNFNFNWMTNYIYADDAAPAFPKGTIIHVTAFYDNTKANKNNPDPNQWVGYGDRTVDEMAHAWMNVYYLSDAEYQRIPGRAQEAGHVDAEPAVSRLTRIGLISDRGAAQCRSAVRRLCARFFSRDPDHHNGEVPWTERSPCACARW